MTLRERIADWLTGGELTRVRQSAHIWAALNMEKAKALSQIEAMETPGANATVRRMARTAREALGDDD